MASVDYRREKIMNTEEIKAGNVVELLSTATYYDGRVIPMWVKQDKWIVKQVNGDRAVIDKNVGGTHSISSPVNVKNLVKTM